jgi:hypothetical protein
VQFSAQLVDDSNAAGGKKKKKKKKKVKKANEGEDEEGLPDVDDATYQRI